MTNTALRIARCTRFELSKLAGRRRTVVVAAVMLVAPLFAGVLESRAADPATSFSLLTEVVGIGWPVASFILTILGCLVLAEDVGSGSLRVVAIAPVRRSEILSGKIGALLLVAVTSWMAVLLVSIAWVMSQGGFSPVTLEIPGLEPVVKFSLDEMNGHAVRLLGATLPALLCSPVFGLLVATIVDGEGAAMAVSIASYAAIRATAGLEGGGAWAFTSGLSHPVELLAELARGVETHLDEVDATGLTSGPMAVGLLTLGLLMTLSIRLFARREIRC